MSAEEELELVKFQRDEANHAAELAHNEAQDLRESLTEWVRLWQKAANAVLALQDERDGCMAEIDRLRFQLAHARYEARDEGEAANRGYGALLAEKNAEIDALRARLAEVEADKKKWLAEYNHYFKESQRRQNEIDVLKATIDDLRSQLGRARGKEWWRA